MSRATEVVDRNPAARPPTPATRLRAILGHPLIILGLLLVAFFYKEVLLGRVFSPADMLLDQNPWHAARPRAFEHATNPLRSDAALITYPHQVDIAADTKRYGIALWQDHTLAGSRQTFALHGLGDWVYPVMLSFLVFGPGLAATIVNISVPFFAGIAMYLLSAFLARGKAARLYGSIAYMLNGYLIVWLSGFKLTVVMAALPLVVFLALKYLRGDGILFGVLFAVATGVQFMFGYPPAVIVMAAIAAVFIVLFWLGSPRERSRRLAGLAGLGVLGLGVGMAGILPTVSDLSNFASHSYHGLEAPIPSRFLAAWLFPNVEGNPISQDWVTIGNYCEFVAYTGLGTLVLAGTGALFALRDRLRAPLALAGVVAGLMCLGLAYSPTVVGIVGRLPVLYDLNPARWTIGIDFAAAVLATGGLDHLLRRDRPRLARGFAAVSLGTVGLAALAIAYVKRHQFLHGDAFITADFRLRVALAVIGAALLAGLLFGRPRLGRLAGAGLVVVLAVDLFTFGVDFNPAAPASLVYPVTPAIAFLQAHAGPYRVLPAGGVYQTDDFNVYGLDVVTGYDHFRDDGYVKLLGDNLSDGERALWRQSGFLVVADQPHLEDPVFNLLSVKYAYFPSQPDPARSAAWTHWTQVYTGSDGVVYENVQVLPRQFIAAADGSSLTPVFHQAARPDRDQLSVTGGGLLVWSKPYSKDWSVTLDGRQVATERYAGYFLAARIAPGAHQVALEYRPQVYLEGALLSLVALAGLAGVYAWSRRR